MAYDASPEIIVTPSAQRVDELVASALAEHPDFYDYASPDELRTFAEAEQARISRFELLGRKALNVVSFDTAQNIGAIQIHSSVGSYDEAFKSADNPRLLDKPWLAWADRKRIDQAAYLAQSIAEARSGYTISGYVIEDLPKQRAEIKELIRQYGPNLIYNGYPVETEKAAEVLRRPNGVIPMENCYIVEGTPRNTVEAIRDFELPDGALEKGKELAIVSHAPHLDRVLHIMERFSFLDDDAKPYVAPVATPRSGRDEFALMEIRGMMNYVYRTDQASAEPHAYQTIS